MSADHEDLENSVAAYVVGSADPEEEDRVRAHLEACSSCRELAARLGLGISALPLEPEPVRPPGRLEERIVAAARGTSSPPPQRTRRQLVFRAPTVRLRFGGMRAALAAAAVLLFAVGAVAGVGIDQRWSPGGGGQTTASDVQRYQLAGTGPMAGVHGSALYLKRDHLTLVDLKYLPGPGENHVYQMWLVPSGGKPLPAGVFTPESDGSKVVLIDHSLDGIKALAVTLEPGPYGSDTPSQVPQLAARIT